MTPSLSPKFLLFLEDYARRVGKPPSTIIEEAVSQAILRHEAADPHEAHDALLIPLADQKQLLLLQPAFDPRESVETTFGEFMERLPDRNWVYQVGRHGEWWFLIVSLAPTELPPPLELRSVETSQAYAWLFGFTKNIKLWSAKDRFLVVF